MLERIIEYSVKNRFIVLLFVILTAVYGVYSLSKIPLDAIPDLSDVQVIIISEWMGQDPETIEDQVTYPITTKMLSVPRVKVVRGFSYFGFSLVYIIFSDGTDIYWARSRVLEYLSELTGKFPPGVTSSLGPDATGVGWVYQYTVESEYFCPDHPRGVYYCPEEDRYYKDRGECGKSGEKRVLKRTWPEPGNCPLDGKELILPDLDLADLRSIQDWYLRYQLLGVPGVAEVASVGGFVKQYQVEVDPNRLLTYGIPLKKVVQAVRTSNNQVGGRLLEMSETEYFIRGLGYFEVLDDIRNIVVSIDENGTPVLIKDIAHVHRGPEIRRGISEKNGKGEVVGGTIVQRFGENSLGVIEDVKEKIKEVEKGLPPGVAIHPAYDRSSLIHRAIDTLKEKIIEESILVTLICFIFLWHIRSALVAVFAIPIGILISFIIMNFMGINANIMSLGGIAIAIGAMIDASIVMIENAHKHMEREGERKDRWLIVVEASKEVGPALFFSLLIITVSFLPVFILPAQSGRLFKPLAFTKTFAMAAGAFLAVTAIPLFMGLFIRGRITPEQRNPVSRFLIACYQPVIHFVLKYPWLIIIGAVVSLAITYFPLKKIGSEFMPPLNEGDILYMPTTVPGISETEAKRLLQTQDKLFMTFPEVKTVFGKVGRAETATDPAPLSMVETTITLKEEKEWPKRWVEQGYMEKRVLGLLRRIKREGPLTLKKEDGKTPGKILSNIAGQADRMAVKDVNRHLRFEFLKDHPGEEYINETLDRKVREVLEKHITRQVMQEKSIEVASKSSLSQRIKEGLDEISFRGIRRRKLTIEELMYEEMDREFKFPGMANAWTMPIKTRIDMLSTGIKTPIGIKVFGEDLKKIQEYAIRIERLFNDPATQPRGTLSAIAERAMGGHYIDFHVEREECARYGITVGDIQDIISTALGGMNITQTVEGRYRFPVNIRYPRDFRDDLEKLKRVLIPTPRGEQIPLGQVARIEVKDGPPGIKSENSMLESIVYVDIQDIDVGTYVKNAKAMLEKNLKMEPGYTLTWSGQYEYMEEANRKLKLIVPVTLIIIFLLLYFNFGNVTDTLIVMLALPFSLVGGIWLIYLLDFNMSVAVGVGFIALAGVAAETGVVMLIYLDIEYRKRLKQGAMTMKALYEAIVHGAVMRVRPKMMTVMAIIMGLLPIMWGAGAGSRAMKRIATPMVGGMVSSTILTLIVIPAIYLVVKRIEVMRREREENLERVPD